MASSGRRAGKRRANGTTETQSAATVNGVPAVYQDLLQQLPGPTEEPADRPAKRRKIIPGGVVKREPAEERALPSRALQNIVQAARSSPDPPTPLQTVEDSEDSDDDLEWEDVPLTQVDATSHDYGLDEVDDGNERLIFTIGGDDQDASLRKRRARKLPTLEERKKRLEIHKVHLLCLIYHCAIRNKWCNMEAIQRTCRAQVPLSKSIVERLSPDLDIRQAERSRLFKETITQLTTFWRNTFTLTSEGMRRPAWDSPADDAASTESFVTWKEFSSKAKHMTGSADYGAQLFCAFLRGLGVETRLVCSLQPLPFSAVGAGIAPKPHAIPTLYAIEDEAQEEPKEESPAKPQRIVRMGRGRKAPARNTAHGTVPQSVARKTRTIPRLRHPVFWVEVFDDAYQKWVTADPMSTGSVARPLLLEPGLSDPDNVLSYVIAFEAPGYARDVTRRYTKAYNAKTRKLRVEYTERGIAWYGKALKPFRKRRTTDRDQLEDATFVQKDMSEGMPRNIEDFKGHPVYVLERHLHRDEVIHPLREAGKVGQTNKAASLSNLESVYRRQDVHTVKSADRWFRLGRQMKEGMEPLKIVASRRRRQHSKDINGGELLEQEKTKLYAQFQTELYVPSPVRDGKVEKNAFGNLDVYVPSMIPPGATHIRADRARDAARLLGIDFADAVVGFKFRGRHGTAVINGVIVASGYRDAMVAVLEGMVDLQKEEIAEQKLERALAWWSKLTHGLQILERVKQYRHPDEESDDEDSNIREMEAELKHYGEDATTEGLILELEIGKIEVIDSPHPVPVFTPIETSNGQVGRLTDLFEEPEDEGGFLPEAYSPRPLDEHSKDYNQAGFIDAAKQGGGFVVEDPFETGGGFISSPKDMMPFSAGQPGNRAQPGDDFLDASNVAGSSAGTRDLEQTVSSTNGLTPSKPVVQEGSPVPDHIAREETPHNEAQVADDESMLSHDPDDDEVDPDWLE